VPLAILYYDKCLTVSEKVGDVEAKGGISHKMGLLFSKQNDYEKSIQYQKQYLEISSLHSNPVFHIFCVNGRRPRRSRWRPTRRSPRPT